MSLINQNFPNWHKYLHCKVRKNKQKISLHTKHIRQLSKCYLAGLTSVPEEQKVLLEKPCWRKHLGPDPHPSFPKPAKCGQLHSKAQLLYTRLSTRP